LIIIKNQVLGAGAAGHARRDGVTPFQRLRVKQIRFTARLLSTVEALPGGGCLMRLLVNWSITAPVLNALLGYHRLFDSFPEAIAAARPYAEGGHENPLGATIHMSLSGVPRPSDYAALFHMQNIITRSSRVFDLGGNVGNLFYCYKRYNNLP
jgi:hypothetical protein